MIETNKIIEGDCLDVLKNYPDECIDLIYVDPPFNSKKKYNVTHGDEIQYQAFGDTWTWNDEVAKVYEKIMLCGDNNVVNVIQSFRNILDKNDVAYYTMMTIRLLEMKRVLKPIGSIYLHCDPTASHYLKVIMDAIFGEENFRNEIVWCYSKWTNISNQFQSNHDIIFFYTKSDDYTFNKLYDEEHIRKHHAKGYHTNTVRVGDKRISQIIVYDKSKVSNELLQKYDNVVYREEQRYVVLQDWWDISIINSQSKERCGYPTQKPEKLLDRIIRASSNENDIVLDPMCGSGTTCYVAEQLNRKWIGIDSNPQAIEVSNKRLYQVVPKIPKVKISNYW